MNFIENIHSLQSNSKYFGKLQVNVKYRYSELPIENATVTIYRMGNPYVFINQLSTDKTGNTPIIELEAPPLEFSMKPSANLPYAEYAIRIMSPGLRTVEIYGVQIYPNEMAIQPVTMYPAAQYDTPEIIIIEPNPLVTNYVPKVYED